MRHNGKDYTLAELCEQYGVKLGRGVTEKLAQNRVRNGEDIAWALSTPKMDRQQISRMGAKASFWRQTRREALLVIQERRRRRPRKRRPA